MPNHFDFKGWGLNGRQGTLGDGGRGARGDLHNETEKGYRGTVA